MAHSEIQHSSPRAGCTREFDEQPAMLHKGIGIRMT